MAGADFAGGAVTGGALVVVVACVVVVLTMVVVDFAIVVVVDDDLGFSVLDDPHAVNKPMPSIDTQRIPAANFCPLVTSCSLLAFELPKPTPSSKLMLGSRFSN